MIERIYRYDLLCIEGIARALRVFLEKDKPPVYRLRIPPGGERELVEVRVTSEVRTLGYREAPQMFILPTDQANPSIVRLCCSARRHLHAPVVSVFYRIAGQAPSKLMPAPATRSHWNP